MELELPVTEGTRIEKLKRYGILDTPPDGSFDRITKLASTIFRVPIAIISLVDSDRIWFKSHYGLSVRQINRDPGLCASAILSNDPYIIEDASVDPRTLANPLVAGEFGLRFYAAAPLQTDDHHNLGTLCLIDKSPRTFTKEEMEILKELADVVMDEMEMRLALRTTVNKIKNLSNDISTHIHQLLENMEELPDNQHNKQLASYLDSSRMFLLNLENQIDELQ